MWWPVIGIIEDGENEKNKEGPANAMALQSAVKLTALLDSQVLLAAARVQQFARCSDLEALDCTLFRLQFCLHLVGCQEGWKQTGLRSALTLPLDAERVWRHKTDDAKLQVEGINNNETGVDEMLRTLTQGLLHAA